jgi:hypothetical protein
MRTPHIFEPFIRSFYSGSFYYQILKRWELKALGYAFLFAALLPLMTAGKFYSFSKDFASVVPADLPAVQKYIDTIRYENVRLYVEPVKDVNIVKEGIFTIPGADGKPLAILNTIGLKVPSGMGGAKYYFALTEAAIMKDGRIIKLNVIPEFTFKSSEGFSVPTSSGIAAYIAKMYPLWARNSIMYFLACAFLFVIPIWGVSRYFGMRLPFYKLLSMSIITLTPAMLSDMVLQTVFNNKGIEFVYISMITIAYEVFAFYRITKIEQDEAEAAEKAADAKMKGGN